MNVPITVSVDEFRVTNVLLIEQVCILFGDVDGHPDAIPTSSIGVVDGEVEPPRRENRILVVFDGDTVVAEDDRLFGVLSRVLVRLDFARLLLDGGVEVRVVTILNTGKLPYWIVSICST